MNSAVRTRPLGSPTPIGAHRRTSRGFTLIELLVVVGIIAVLSSIAVPNYQDALARSKVSKFMGDGRAVETAMETFYVDHGLYPSPDAYPIGSSNGGWDAAPASPGLGFLTRRLTTPVAYLGKLPIDPFPNRSPEYTPPNKPNRIPYNYASDLQNMSGGRVYYVSNVCYALQGGTMRSGTRPSNAIWEIRSPGPDGDCDDGWNVTNVIAVLNDSNSMVTVFDPTNGAVSDGDLFMFGPSIGFPGH